MLTKNKIALSLPYADKPGKSFSFRLKQVMYNEPAEYNQARKIFVLADIEGNFRTFCKLLYAGGVIDKYLKWNFDDGHLVLVGDCFDRGDQVTECLWLIYSLEEKARKNGGYVHFILGNHEIMNLNGDWRYVHPKYAEKGATFKNPPAALYDGNAELWRWLRTKNIMEKIGDTIFVHGGIAPELLRLNLSVAEINNLARTYYNRANELFTDPALNTIFNSESSPFWYRGYYQQAVTEEQIDSILDQFGVKTIITGHTIVDRITLFFNGKVINVDTNHATENSEALLIRNGKLYRIDSKGRKEKIK
jgi:hypothetical protein